MLRLLGHFDVHVDRVMHVEEALSALHGNRYELVLVNRLVFADGSDALPLIERMKADPELRAVPVMMISNYADAQNRAVAAGALPGFGKAAMNDAATIAQLKSVLSSTVEAN